MGGRTISVLETGGTHVTAGSVRMSTSQGRRCTRHGPDSGAPAPQLLATPTSTAQQRAGTVPAACTVAVPDPFDHPHAIALFRLIAAPLPAASADRGASGVDGRPARRTPDAPLIDVHQVQESTSEVVV